MVLSTLAWSDQDGSLLAFQRRLHILQESHREGLDELDAHVCHGTAQKKVTILADCTFFVVPRDLVSLIGADDAHFCFL